LAYVAVSEVAVPSEGACGLEQAFRDRVRLVERADGFLGIEVLRDRRRRGRYLMITHWTSKEAFRAYMQSADHAVSHARIPGGPLGPRAAGFSDYDTVDV